MTCHRPRGYCAGAIMDGQWLTYRELANRLGVGVEAARRRAQRACWSRQHGNDGKTRVHLPDDYEIERRPDGAGAVLPLHPDGALDAISPERETIAALEGHVATLKADVERLEADLAAERARTEKAIAAFAALAERLDALAAERARPWWRRLVG